MKSIKLLLFAITVFISFISNSQRLSVTYYDYAWRKCMMEDARFYSVKKHTDSGWYKTVYFINLKKMQMTGLYKDEENTIKNGTFYCGYPNGNLKTIGNYVHDKKDGIWLDYFQDNSLKDSLNYKDGNLLSSLSWYTNGFMKDSLNLDSTGRGVYFSWFDNGNLSSVGKYIEYDKQDGKWQYFHKNGNLSSLETYDQNILINRKYFNEDGVLSPDTTSQDSEAHFEGNKRAWEKYLNSNLHFPKEYEIKNNNEIDNVFNITISDEGKIIDVEVSVPVSPEIDKMGKDVLESSPTWVPAISHNRKVYSTISQQIHYGYKKFVSVY